MSEEPGDDERESEPTDRSGADGSSSDLLDSEEFTFPADEEEEEEEEDEEENEESSDQSAAEPTDHADTSEEADPSDDAGSPEERDGAADASVDLSERWSTDRSDVDLSERWSSDPQAVDSTDASGAEPEDRSGDGPAERPDSTSTEPSRSPGADGGDEEDVADDDAEDASDGDDAEDVADDEDVEAAPDDEPASDESGTDAPSSTEDDDAEPPPGKVNRAPVGSTDDKGRSIGSVPTPDLGGDAEPQPGGSDGSETDDPEDADDSGADRSPASAASADEARGTAGDGAGATAHDGGTATGTGATTGGASTGGSTLGGHVSTPPDDEELPLTEHIEEMLSRMMIVVVVATLATLAVVPVSGDLIGQIWYDVHPGSIDQCLRAPRPESCKAPHVYGPFEFVLMRIKIAGLAGLLVALPLVVYQTYRFMRPGLYPKERRYYLASVPFSLVLGAVGMAFSYFVILPLLFEYFITYTEGSATPAFALTDTMSLVLVMLGMTAVIFQIPLFIMLAIMMGLVTREWLEGRRIYFWGLFLGVAFLFGPDPTGMAPVLLTGTMIVLFEATLLLLRWTGR